MVGDFDLEGFDGFTQLDDKPSLGVNKDLLKAERRSSGEARTSEGSVFWTYMDVTN